MHRLLFACLLALAPGCRRSETGVAAEHDTKPPGSAEASTKADSDEGDTASDPSPPSGPILTEVIRAARDAAQRQVLPGLELQPDLRSLPQGPLPGETLTADPLPGFFTPLEYDQPEHPLRAFESALAQLESGERTEPVRVAVYGASATAADLWTAYLRRYLQARFGDAGAGFVSPAPHNRWYRHHELAVKASKHWRKHNAYRRESEDDPGWFGPMGAAMSAESKRAWAEIGPSRQWPSTRPIAWYELMYVQQRAGGRFRVRLEGQPPQEVSTKLASEAEEPQLGVVRMPVESGAESEPPSLRIDVVGDGEVRLLGVIAESDRPGIVLDTFGVNGAKASNQLTWHEDLWAEGLRRRAPVLYLFMFGNNEAADMDEPISTFESSMREVLERFARTLPDASCVIMGPGDFPIVNDDGELEPRPRLDEIRDIERRLAGEYGCAFWNSLAFMGGHGAKAAWLEAGLGKDDYLHLTRRGYVRMGMAITDALMQHYDWTRQRDDAVDASM